VPTEVNQVPLVGRATSWPFWTAIYFFVLIPIFAKLYERNADGFYMSTASVDYETTQARSQLEQRLTALVSQWLDAAKPGATGHDNLHIVGTSTNGSGLSFFATYNYRTGGRTYSSTRRRILWELFLPAEQNSDQSGFRKFEVAVTLSGVASQMTNAHSTKNMPGDTRKVGPLIGSVKEADDPNVKSAAHRGIIEGVLHLDDDEFAAVDRYIRIAGGHPRGFEDRSCRSSSS